MNSKLDIFKETVRGREVAVLGIGISNLPLIRFLLGAGAKVTARDKKTAAELGANVCRELGAAGVRLVLGEEYLEGLSGDYIFKTPGLRFDVPQLLAAKAAGSRITSEMDVFFTLCDAKKIGVTGSDGKTTTTTLIYEILSKSGYKCHLGGNIGTPLLPEIENIGQSDVVIVELSSFQLHTMTQSPDIAVVTNISPNHLDVHKSYGEYIDAKKNIFRYQTQKGRLVLNRENEITRAFAREARGEVIFFGYGGACEIAAQNGMIFYKGEPVLKTDDIKIPGRHNAENFMAAIGAAGDMADKAAIVKTAREFNGVAHRIELVRELDGVRYYESSIDSSPNRTVNTLNVFPEKLILICGGKEKGLSYDALGEAVLNKVKTLILIGKTAPEIHEAVLAAAKGGGGQEPDIFYCETYGQVVKKAREVARAGDIVLLSPASTSFDMFKNFEERGDLFKTLVREL